MNPLALTCLVALLAAASSAFPQAYPAQIIRVVSNSAAGAPGDLAARVLVEKMARNIGRPVIIETRQGAGGEIAAAEVLKAEPDGYTLLFSSSQLLGAKFLRKQSRIAIDRDFVAISQAVEGYNFLAVHKSVPAGSLQEFVAHAKQNPNKLTYSSNGVGSSLHMQWLGFMLQTGTQLRHVPYGAGGENQRYTDFLTGRISANLINLGAMQGFLEKGDVKPLAMMDDERNPRAPEVPTVYESMPNYRGSGGFYGFWGRRGMDRAIVGRLSKEVQAAAADPETIKRLAPLDIKPKGSTSEAFTAKVDGQLKLIEEIVKATGLEAK